MGIGMPKNILIGICGWGNGHCMRQTPTIKHLLKQGHNVVVLGFKTSVNNFEEIKKDYPHHFHVIETGYFFTPSDRGGVSFNMMARSPHNLQHHVMAQGGDAIANAQKIIGNEDFNIVISDSEFFSSLYAVMCGVPLLSYDNQSKWLAGDFPEEVDGYTITDGIQRARMYALNPTESMAISFFTFEEKDEPDFFKKLTIYPPVIRESVLALKDKPVTPKRSIVVYISPNLDPDDIKARLQKTMKALEVQSETDFHVFVPHDVETLPDAFFDELKNTRIEYYRMGDERYYGLLGSCHGIIGTAGHTMISEAMYLAKPYLATPLAYYEQAYNALRVEEGKFGMKCWELNETSLDTFLSTLSVFKKNIEEDRGKRLNREPGQDKILRAIDAFVEKYANKKEMEPAPSRFRMF